MHRNDRICLISNVDSLLIGIHDIFPILVQLRSMVHLAKTIHQSFSIVISAAVGLSFLVSMFSSFCYMSKRKYHINTIALQTLHLMNTHASGSSFGWRIRFFGGSWSLLLALSFPFPFIASLSDIVCLWLSPLSFSLSLSSATPISWPCVYGRCNHKKWY